MVFRFEISIEKKEFLKLKLLLRRLKAKVLMRVEANQGQAQYN